jgi:acyl carrier protein
MDEKKIITIVSKALKKKVDIKSNVKNTEEWDSLGHLSILSALEKATKGKSSKIDLTEVQSVKQLCIKIKKIKIIN